MTHATQLQVDQVTPLRALARALWLALREHNRGAPLAVFLDAKDSDPSPGPDVYRAIEAVFIRHHVLIVPCRVILDPVTSPNAWPTQSEAYLGRWPDGSTRNLSRDQVLMMAGMDIGADDTPTDDVPF